MANRRPARNGLLLNSIVWQKSPKMRSHSFVRPPQHSLSEGLAQINVALRIHGKVVDVEELPGAVPAVPAKPADHFEPAAVENLHLFVNPIRNIDEPLLSVRREADIERRWQKRGPRST